MRSNSKHIYRSFQWFHFLMILLIIFLVSIIQSNLTVQASFSDSKVVSSEKNAVDTARYLQIVAGSIHTCGLSPAGAVQCWGSNWAGQLGNGTYFSSAVPVNVNGLSSGVIALSAGVNYTCALLDGGEIKCWGENEFGMLGDGTTIAATVPVFVDGIQNAISVGAGGAHTCAALEDGSVKCWGRNHVGQLGLGTMDDTLVPSSVQGLSGPVSKVEAGISHTCAVLDNGNVQCWGNNEFGQLGDGTNDNSNTPVLVSGLLAAVSQLSTERDHTCVVMANGTIQCWGQNWAGQLGNGETQNANSPVQVTGLAASALSVMAGGGHSCAIETGGLVQCWGANDRGQLGNGLFVDSLAPVDVIGLSSGVVALGGEFSHTCASSPTKSVCWGINWEGELGDGIQLVSSAPRDVALLGNNIQALAAGNVSACALDENGVVKCWGSNYAGQIGNNDWNQVSNPTAVIGLDQPVQQIDVFEATVCALDENQAVKCWGLNDLGQVGDGTNENALVPRDVIGLQSDVTFITTGRFHNCAVLQNGTAQCWGNNQYGQLGDASYNHANQPVTVADLSNISAVSAGSDHTCALLFDKTVKCWGGNGDGQLGDGTNDSSLTPVMVGGLSNIKALASSLWDTCALTEGGAVKCWGSNHSGQLGNGSGAPSNVPVDVIGMSSGVTSISGGYDHFCAVKNEALYCWGANNQIQLGSGQTIDSSSTPLVVEGMAANITEVSTGSAFSCAIASGRAKCWGNNSGDSLGLGRDLFFAEPLMVVEDQPQILQVNYSDGAPGSVFVARGSGFPAGQSMTVNVVNLESGGSDSKNGSVQGAQIGITTNALGEFIMFLETQGADQGTYQLSTQGTAGLISSVLTIDDSAQIRQPEGGGKTLSIFYFVYLPMLTR
ncbi:MAG: RCC1 repeat-containing protein [Chloroflexi bacterium HGW-Chloroflexi-10]|nr:MAG: RCC1 repeat-containing protein [Chloroflexi bacterium HGW-Chloroflexi-10]